MDSRIEALRGWVEKSLVDLGVELAVDWQLTPVSGDASFRRYFRARSHNLSWIAVDAPLEHENSAAFVAIARAFEALGIAVPHVHGADLGHGFMLLSDLGDTLYLERLDEQSAEHLYGQALITLTHIQQCGTIQGEPLPPYDRALLEREMALFRDWFLGDLLRLSLDNDAQILLENHFERLVLSALEQPRVCVHRDYHSRNLMVIGDGPPGVIDFQDAVEGPVTYDLVSLLRDCYVAWPADRVEHWALDYYELACQAGILQPDITARTFLRWFDHMGMQRHLKAIGIFSRLKIRDDKSGYLADIPRTLNYLLEVGDRYADCAAFNAFLRRQVVPAMKASGLFELQA